MDQDFPPEERRPDVLEFKNLLLHAWIGLSRLHCTLEPVRIDGGSSPLTPSPESPPSMPSPLTPLGSPKIPPIAMVERSETPNVPLTPFFTHPPSSNPLANPPNAMDIDYTHETNANPPTPALPSMPAPLPNELAADPSRADSPANPPDVMDIDLHAINANSLAPMPTLPTPVSKPPKGRPVLVPATWRRVETTNQTLVEAGSSTSQPLAHAGPSIAPMAFVMRSHSGQVVERKVRSCVKCQKSDCPGVSSRRKCPVPCRVCQQVDCYGPDRKRPNRCAQDPKATKGGRG